MPCSPCCTNARRAQSGRRQIKLSIARCSALLAPRRGQSTSGACRCAWLSSGHAGVAALYVQVKAIICLPVGACALGSLPATHVCCSFGCWCLLVCAGRKARSRSAGSGCLSASACPSRCQCTLRSVRFPSHPLLHVHTRRLALRQTKSCASQPVDWQDSSAARRCEPVRCKGARRQRWR